MTKKMGPLKIEVLTQISGVSFDQALQGSRTFDLDGYDIPYIGRSALIRNKKAAGRSTTAKSWVTRLHLVNELS